MAHQLPRYYVDPSWEHTFSDSHVREVRFVIDSGSGEVVAMQIKSVSGVSTRWVEAPKDARDDCTESLEHNGIFDEIEQRRRSGTAGSEFPLTDISQFIDSLPDWAAPLHA